MIENILKFADSHAQAVSLVLLGVIVVGSVGGGLWINNLQSNLDYKDKIIDERLKLVEERNQRRLSILNQRVILLTAQVDKLRNELPTIGEDIQIIKNELEVVLEVVLSSNKDIDTKSIEKLNFSMDLLNDKTIALSNALKHSDDMVELMRRVETSTIIDGAFGGGRSMYIRIHQSSLLLAFGLLITVVIIIAIRNIRKKRLD